MQKVNKSREGKEPLKSNANLLMYEDLAEINQVTKDEISN